VRSPRIAAVKVTLAVHDVKVTDDAVMQTLAGAQWIRGPLSNLTGLPVFVFRRMNHALQRQGHRGVNLRIGMREP